MADLQDKLPTKSNTTVWISIYSILLALLIVFTWYFINTYSNSQYKFNSKNCFYSKQIHNPFKSLTLDSTHIYKLTDKDVEKINEHLDYLTEKVNDEVEKAQRNTEYDIDRINTFLSIGLALLAVIGGLLPLVVNFFSKEHLESKIKDLELIVKESKSTAGTASKDATKAKEDAGKALNSMQGYEGRIKAIEGDIESLSGKLRPISDEVAIAKKVVAAATEKIPFITSLVLQNAVARLLSVSNIRYYTESNRYKKLSKVLDGIISGLEECKKDGFDKHTDGNLSFFIDVITDLKIGLQFNTFRLNLSRKLQAEIDELAVFLDNFTIGRKEEFKTLLEQSATKLTAIKNSIDQME